jgi:hypothetical protein
MRRILTSRYFRVLDTISTSRNPTVIRLLRQKEGDERLVSSVRCTPSPRDHTDIRVLDWEESDEGLFLSVPYVFDG